MWYAQGISQREQYAESKGSRAAQKGRLSRETSGHAKKCGLFLLGTEWEVTLPDLCVSKASLTAVWRTDWRRQDQRQGTPVTTIAKSRGEIVKARGKMEEGGENRLSRMGRL